MNTIRLYIFLIIASFANFTAAAENHILLIPYAPSMHLSTADVEISMYSGIDIGELREKFRTGILRSLNSSMTGDRQLDVLQSDHVIAADGTDQVLYKSIFYQQDTIWPMKYKGLDSLLKKKISYTIKNKLRPVEKSYMNIGFHDQRLLGELAESYGADTFLFLNEFEIKDNVKDCMDVEGQVHDREVRIHYSVFNREGRQLHGDVAVAHVWSNVNDAEEIMQSTYPSITAYILSSIPAR